MRIVLDADILVSALITKATPPDQLYQAWLRNEVEQVTSAAKIDEVTDVLARPRMRRYVDPDGGNSTSAPHQRCTSRGSYPMHQPVATEWSSMSSRPARTTETPYTMFFFA